MSANHKARVDDGKAGWKCYSLCVLTQQAAAPAFTATFFLFSFIQVLLLQLEIPASEQTFLKHLFQSQHLKRKCYREPFRLETFVHILLLLYILYIYALLAKISIFKNFLYPLSSLLARDVSFWGSTVQFSQLSITSIHFPNLLNSHLG